MRLLAKTFYGLEEVLAKELEELGAKDITIQKRAVSFNSNKELLYKSNLCLRTALRILQPIYTFKATNEQELYNKISEFNWTNFFNVEQTFAIDSVVFSNYFTHSKYVALKMKDAIVDQFRDKFGKRPNIDVDSPDMRLTVHVAEKNFTISMDSSGDSLHKRGYRELSNHKAPLNEILAAGMLKLAGWTPDQPLIDPMCGSGTILMEAAMMACNIPPAYKRKQFGFQTWNNYDAELWQKIYDEETAKITHPRVQIYGGDISGEAIDTTKKSALNFGLHNEIKVERVPFEKGVNSLKEGIIITNPPYGERLRKEDINLFYKNIGNKLKSDFSGFDAWIISSNQEALKNIGLRPAKKLTLFNGSLECKYQCFSMYSGSKKR